jgi:predicted ATP-dependent endonuclease of OLD family
MIDEAERHLHYDAQADVISVFERQREAAKVIYTTHSAGCLPHDLGTGIRAVLPTYADENFTEQTDQSRIVDSIWVHGEGFSPLLFALGASVFAFSSVQRAAVTEGLSDALLLPSLIREATGKARLAYQIVPGFAQAPKADADNFDLMASRVAFVADSNEGGRLHIEGLKPFGVRPEQVAWLGDDPTAEIDLEDLLAVGVYVDAINSELHRWYPDLSITPDDIPETGRSHAVEAWAASRDANVNKPAVAQRILDRRDSAHLVAPPHRGTLRALDRKLEAIFARPTHLL